MRHHPRHDGILAARVYLSNAAQRKVESAIARRALATRVLIGAWLVASGAFVTFVASLKF